MTLLFTDGMDAYGSDVDISSKWDAVDVYELNYNGIGGRFGGGAIELFDDENDLIKFFPASGQADGSQDFCLAFAVRPLSVLTASNPIVVFRSVEGTEIGLFFYTDGSIRVIRGTAVHETEIATSGTGAFAIDAWHWIEFRARISTTVGQVECLVNGVSVFNVGPINTSRSGTSSPVERMSWGGHGGSAGTGFLVDDIIVWNLGGSDFASFPIGDTRIDTLRPNGSGDVSDSTIAGSTPAPTRWQSVDDLGFDGGATVVEFSTFGSYDSYETEDLSHTPTTVRAVVVNGVIETTGSSRMINLATRTSSVSAYTGDIPVPLGSFKTAQGFFTQDPWSAAWIPTEVNAMQIGLYLSD